MPVWSNPPLVLFHGSDAASVGALGVAMGTRLPNFVVNLTKCRPNTDFGQGFYTTTNDHQARQWANLRVNRVRPIAGNCAVVLAFTVDRDWLAGLDTLAFVRPISDFWNLVQDCRHGFAPHARNAPVPPVYDVVYGPVSLWPQRLVIADCDQISFHTLRAVGSLSATVYDVATNTTF